MNNWINKSIALNDIWGPGSTDTLTTPLGHMPEFSMRARHMRNAGGTPLPSHFSIDFSSGYLHDGWQGVHFTPMGTDPVTGITGLPPWDKSQAVKDLYRRTIDNATVFSSSRTMRLEAVVPYVSSRGDVEYNRVRLYYLTNAVNGPARDLVVVKIASHAHAPGTVQARQDGNGQGPPR